MKESTEQIRNLASKADTTTNTKPQLGQILAQREASLSRKESEKVNEKSHKS